MYKLTDRRLRLALRRGIPGAAPRQRHAQAGSSAAVASVRQRMQADQAAFWRRYHEKHGS